LVYRVSILVKDRDAMLDWARTNVPALIRTSVFAINYPMWKQGIISICTEGAPETGWIVGIFVKDREVAESIVSAWQADADYCELDVIGV